ncbi:hypothetical protein HNP65_001939 [Thermosipho japonicus]|uniref:Uncharacterized protein n=1 Tax=Thermosipho japonicus TaxID=90323 RepID=A0A841GU26_9BACT|nr:hypothetical protein [Thermosipho japonicus]MBB6063468.1 hypothetical protein [Thermosipho japonicus]
MKQLIDAIFQKEPSDFKSLIGYIYRLKEISKILGFDSLYKSRTVERERRPAIVEDNGKNSLKLLFLSTKSYSKIKVDINKFCVISEDFECSKLVLKSSYAFNYHKKLVFKLPRKVIEENFVKCGLCRKNIKNFIEVI